MRHKIAKNGRRDARTEQIPIRFSPIEKAAVERVAAEEHEYPSSYMRRLVMKQIANSGRSLEAVVFHS